MPYEMTEAFDDLATFTESVAGGASAVGPESHRNSGVSVGGGNTMGSVGGGNNASFASSASQSTGELHNLCESASEDDLASWDAVRNWLSVKGANEARRSAERLGEYNTTPLHLACRNSPPTDVVDVLLSAAPDTVRWEDSFGWLPLHYACANGAAVSVLRALSEAFPESKTATDRRGEFAVSILFCSVFSSLFAVKNDGFNFRHFILFFVFNFVLFCLRF